MKPLPKRSHFIAIGGSVMHSLAITLKNMGSQVSGSDDDIFEPSKTLLDNAGLLPKVPGWFPEKISKDLDAVILGMHARADNPELLKAQELGIPIYSFPEFITLLSENKQRVVVSGSHGKTTITAMIIHVLNYFHREFDFVIGANVPGLDTRVKLSDAPVIIIEGDEYLCSAIDPTPKFLKYKHHIGLISGISWDHINVFPTEDDYVKQFDFFADATPKAGCLVFCDEDPLASIIGNKEREDVLAIPYKTHPFTIEDGTPCLQFKNELIQIKVFGKHNMQNISAAKEVLKRLGVSEEMFFQAIPSFEGASQRLELFAENSISAIYKDYAHAPSKVQATVRAMREQYPNRELLACLELHTFSSLNPEFINQYEGTMKPANMAVVFYNPEAVAQKKMTPIPLDDIKKAFGQSLIKVFTERENLEHFLRNQNWKHKNLLLMTSGNFQKLDMEALSADILKSI